MKTNINRFNFNATTIDEAKEYLYNRAKQLLRCNYILTEIKEYEWGLSSYFKKDSKTYQSLYTLDQYRGKGIYQKNVTHTILTTFDCGIIDFLEANNIQYEIAFIGSRCHSFITRYYGDKKAKRSGVYLMNHIDEGLFILNKINASQVAKEAYCLHPIFQSDEALLDNLDFFKKQDFNLSVDPEILISVMEYRSVANEYLSKRKIKSINEIRLSTLKDVNDMLIADKIQNKKDFELYHKGTHPRSKELEEYFNNWLDRLGVSEEQYNEIVNILKTTDYIK